MRCVFTFVVCLVFAKTSYTQSNSLAGHWEGGISRMGAIQTMRFDFYAEGDSIRGNYDDPASAVFNAPFYNLKLVGDTLLMNFGYGNFKAFFHRDLNEITGVNTAWNPKIDMHFRKYGQKTVPSFTQEEVTIKNGNINIAASIFKPANQKQFPLVVLIHGSDITHRKMGYYYSQAYNLAQKGIGVLLYDQRGNGQTNGEYETATFRDLASDAEAAVRYITSRKDLPITKTGLFGTSQGAWLSYMVAKKVKAVKFIVANVGPAVSLYQQDIDRVQYSMANDDYKKASIDSAVTYAKNYFQYVSGKLSWQDFQPMTRQVEKSTFTDYISIPKNDKDKDFYWWRNNEYDPAEDLSTIHCPVLSLLGEKDVLVPPASNEKLMRQYLTKSGQPFQIKVYPNSGHALEVFSTLKGGEWKFPQKFWVWKRKAPMFYETIIPWIKSI
jgi:pimeloyl-ACP methyl ester carboxylesterase